MRGALKQGDPSGQGCGLVHRWVSGPWKAQIIFIGQMDDGWAEQVSSGGKGAGKGQCEQVVGASIGVSQPEPPGVRSECYPLIAGSRRRLRRDG